METWCKRINLNQAFHLVMSGIAIIFFLCLNDFNFVSINSLIPNWLLRVKHSYWLQSLWIECFEYEFVLFILHSIFTTNAYTLLHSMMCFFFLSLLMLFWSIIDESDIFHKTRWKPNQLLRLFHIEHAPWCPSI